PGDQRAALRRAWREPEDKDVSHRDFPHVPHRVLLPAACALLATALLATALPADAAQPSRSATADAPAARPNTLLIISDDIGMDASSGMYPGLIDDLLRQYGPDGHNHPRYREIQGRPASTPNLNALAQAGMKFTQA